MRKTHGKRTFKLINLYTGEVFKLNYKKNKEKIIRAIDIILENRFMEEDELEDNEFIRTMRKRSIVLF